MPTPQELAAKSKEQLAEEEQREASTAYYNAARAYITCPTGHVARRQELKRKVASAERAMANLFKSDSEERMRVLSLKAYRGEAM